MSKYIIVGNPNTGKTSLFNTITRSKEKTANWSGVTVAEKSKTISYKGSQIEIVDLPGLYSLSTSGKDEQVAREFLEKNKDSTIIFVCASNTINKNLLLFIELLKEKYKLKLLINNVDSSIDNNTIDKAKVMLGISILQADVRKNRDKLLSWIVEDFSPKEQKGVNYGELLELFSLKDSGIQWFDKILLRPIWGKIIFVVVFFAIMFISYGPIGVGISDGLEGILSKYSQMLYNYLVDINWIIFADFFKRVIVGAVLTLIIYLPQLVLMLSLLYVLEDVGFLPRVAYLFNLDLQKIGMNGKSIFSLMVGVGCTTSAMLVTRNIENNSLKMNTARFLPYIGCSAKIPILLIVSSILFSKLSVLVVLLILLTGVAVGISYLKLTGGRTSGEYFICELPRLKLPDIKKAILESVRIAVDFIKKVVVSVFLVATIMWVLLSIDTNFIFLSGGESILEWAVDKISFIFKPIGLNNSPMIIALLSGLIAKENIISSIGLFGGFGSFDYLSMATFLVFLLFYSPCIPALKCAKCEFGKGFAIKIFSTQCVIAYICSFVFYNFGRVGLWLGFVSLYIMVILLLAYSKLKSLNEVKLKNPINKRIKIQS